MSCISVVIGIFGDKEFWIPLAEKAKLSALNQLVQPYEVNIVYKNTLHEARNTGAKMTSGDWLCFLDADDTLDKNYFSAMQASMIDNSLLYPSVTYVGPNGMEVGPLLHFSNSLFRRNFMVIGTLVKRSVFIKVGGFRDFEMYEDWDLWMRCCLSKQLPKAVPSAIYRAMIRKKSRNTCKRDEKKIVYNAIRNEYTAEEADFLSSIQSKPAGGLIPKKLKIYDLPWIKPMDETNAIIPGDDQ